MEINRYESDRSLREKLGLEWQKLKSLSWPKRLEYIVSYYKWYFLGIFAIGFVIYTLGTMIYNTQYTTVFSAIIINGATDGDVIAEDFKAYCEDTEKFNKYEVNAGMYLEGSTMKDQDTLGIMLGAIAGKDVQVLILPEFQVERYMDQGALLPMEEILTEEQMEAYGDAVKECCLQVSDNERLAGLGCYPGEDAYLAVLTYVDDLTYVNKFIEYLMGE